MVRPSHQFSPVVTATNMKNTKLAIILSGYWTSPSGTRRRSSEAVRQSQKCTVKVCGPPYKALEEGRMEPVFVGFNAASWV